MNGSETDRGRGGRLLPETVFDFPGGGPGKTDNKNLVGWYVIMGQERQNASCDDRCFAGTGAGQHQSRPLFVQDHLLLFRVVLHTNKLPTA